MASMALEFKILAPYLVLAIIVIVFFTAFVGFRLFRKALREMKKPLGQLSGS